MFRVRERFLLQWFSFPVSARIMVNIPSLSDLNQNTVQPVVLTWCQLSVTSHGSSWPWWWRCHQWGLVTRNAAPGPTPASGLHWTFMEEEGGTQDRGDTSDKSRTRIQNKDPTLQIPVRWRAETREGPVLDWRTQRPDNQMQSFSQECFLDEWVGVGKKGKEL